MIKAVLLRRLYGQAPMGLEGSKVVRQFGVYSIVW